MQMWYYSKVFPASILASWQSLKDVQSRCCREHLLFFYERLVCSSRV